MIGYQTMQRYVLFHDKCFLLYICCSLETLFNYIIIYFLTKVEANYANDTQDSNPDPSEDAEKQRRVQRVSYSSEKEKRDSYDGKVQQ